MPSYDKWAALAVAVACLLSGCSRKSAGADGTPILGSGTQASAGEKHYPLKGEVLSVDVAHKTLRVRHDAIPGLMPAMTMDYPVSEGDAEAARPGEHIRAVLVMDKSGNARLEKIWPDDKVADDRVAAAASALREDTHDRGEGAYREIGEVMPNFSLYDQDGRVVTSSRFRGDQVMLNFIFTRCPVANMCPASTAKMMAAQRMAREAGIKNIQFVSITLDPTYDTPGVLKEYAEARDVDTSNFSFLTGPEGAVNDLLTQFGVIADFDGDLVKHTLDTVLIDAKGRIIWRDTGSSWDPEDFVSRMRKG